MVEFAFDRLEPGEKPGAKTKKATLPWGKVALVASGLAPLVKVFRPRCEGRSDYLQHFLAAAFGAAFLAAAFGAVFLPEKAA